MNINSLDDEIGDVITDGRTNEESLILLSEKVGDDIRRSVIKNHRGGTNVIDRYGSHKADDGNAW